MEWITKGYDHDNSILSTTPPESERKQIEVLLALSGKIREQGFYHGRCRNKAPHGKQLNTLMVRCIQYQTTHESYVVLVKPCSKHLQDYLEAGYEEL
jgi:hypothetical protein